MKKEWIYPGYIARYQLLQTRQWWTEYILDTFLPVADKFVPNYLHDTSQIMRLYDLSKIFSIEKTIQFKKFIFETNKHYFKDYQKKTINNYFKKEKNKLYKKRRLNKKNDIASKTKLDYNICSSDKKLEQMGLL